MTDNPGGPAGPDFAQAKRLARKVLLDQRPPRLPVEVACLRLRQDVTFSSMEDYCRKTSTTLGELACGSDCLKDGCTLLRERGGKRSALVLYNGAVRHPGRRRFTLAHELGHILLGHQTDGDLQEMEANFFAVQLLVPDALLAACLHRVQPVPEGELADLFGVSLQMLRHRTVPARQGLPAGDLALLKRYRHLLPGDGEPGVGY